jgi:sulfonate transport system substrate-binding protein
MRLAHLAGIALLAMVLAACTGKVPESDSAPLAIRLALPMQPSSGLALIAREQGFFAQRGLTVSYTEYPSGKRALNEGLLAGQADVAFTADVPIVAAVLAGKSFKVLATTFHDSDVNRVIARKDRGIRSVQDLRGKRVATQKGSAVHFFLSLLLNNHGMTVNDIQLSYMKAEELVPALLAGSIDAFSMREPYVSETKSKLGDDAVIFSAPGLYQQFDSLLVGTEFLIQQPQAVDKLLLALRDAEGYAMQYPEEALGIVASKVGVSKETLRPTWEKHAYSLALEQSYLVILEDITRWMINSKLAESSGMPNYLRFIDTGPLDRLDRGRVALFR